MNNKQRRVLTMDSNNKKSDMDISNEIKTSVPDNFDNLTISTQNLKTIKERDESLSLPISPIGPHMFSLWWDFNQKRNFSQKITHLMRTKTKEFGLDN